MSYTRRYATTVTADSSGNATAYIPEAQGELLSGTLRSIRYDRGSTSTMFSTGADFTITVEASGQGVWSGTNVGGVSATKSPGIAVHSTAGTALTYGTTVATGVQVCPIALGSDRLKIVIAQGGNAKSGTFHAVIG